MKSRNALYIHQMAGRFPGANNLEEFWNLLKEQRVAESTHLAQYWGLSEQDLTPKSQDGAITMPFGKLCSFREQKRSLIPRQIQAAIEVINELLGKDKREDVSLVIATEWTDPTYYEAQLGKIPKSKGYSVQAQIETIKKLSKIGGCALAVDTACASSLYGLEIARSILERSQSRRVIVIGLNMYLHSFLYRGFSKLGAFSHSGKLRSFDQLADGIIPGESVAGMIVSYEKKGACAKIEGIGLSCDGKEGSPFSPGLEGQLNSYRRAYKDADLSPQNISYIEAHGTGTVLGDKTEAQSIKEFFTKDSGKILVASSKANIGHTLAASGMVALIKCAMMLKKKEYLPHIPINDVHFQNDNHIEVAKKTQPISEEKVYVAVSSFGFGGSNAHVILSNDLSNEESFPLKNTEIYIYDYEIVPADQLRRPAPILKGVPLGPRMQERIDSLQRHMLAAVQNLLSRRGDAKEQNERMSCLFLNNLGGTLSLKYEEKYHLKKEQPELSIEGISSTLPSMISGYPAAVFNFKGHHCLLSGTEGSMEDLLVMLPSIMDTLEGDLILGIGNYSECEIEEKLNSPFLIMYLSKKKGEHRAIISLDDNNPKFRRPKLQDHGVATGVKELINTLVESNDTDDKQKVLNLLKSSWKIEICKAADSQMTLADAILKRSEVNTKVALEYLALLKSLSPDNGEIFEEKVGEFLINARKNTEGASAQLVVDESHPYFFDHPLDHVPGILMIHACEELLSWYKGVGWSAVGMSIRFTKFLEKNQKIEISCRSSSTQKLEFNIVQNKRSVGIINFDIVKEELALHSGIVDEENLSIEDKKITHKHRKDNILVSKLSETNRFSAQARDFSKAGHQFFSALLKKRQSLLYYSEVGRQFIMSMAHLEKKIPLDKKMNLISIEVDILKRIAPPFDLVLNKFEIIPAQNFSFADVHIDMLNRQEVFGKLTLKAQVVDSDYYKKQRGQG